MLGLTPGLQIETPGRNHCHNRLGQELIERNNPRDAHSVRITAIPVARSENRSQICCGFTSPRTTR